MLQLHIESDELFDDKKKEFVYVKEQDVVLEHSLVSISKWESKWHKPFLGEEEKTPEEILDYIRCMMITKNVDEAVYLMIAQKHSNEIVSYIKDRMSATTFGDENPDSIYYKDPKKTPNKEIITSEVIYYQMTALQIPVEFEKWHLNRLLTLIKVCAIKNDPDHNKMSKKELANKYAALNAKRIKANANKKLRVPSR